MVRCERKHHSALVFTDNATGCRDLEIVPRESKNLRSAFSVLAALPNDPLAFDAPCARLVGDTASRVFEYANECMIGSICDVVRKHGYMINGVEAALRPLASKRRIGRPATPKT